MSNEKFYNSKQISDLCDISLETVRVWSEQFSEYLSPTANPGRRRTRQFTEEDMQVIVLVADMKKQAHTFNDIHASLKSGQRIDVTELLAKLDEQTEETDTPTTDLIKSKSITSLPMLQAEYDKLLTKLEALQQAQQEKQEENIRLQVRLELMQEQLQDLKEQVRGDRTLSEKRLEDAYKRIQDLERQVGEAYSKGVLDALHKRGDLPE